MLQLTANSRHPDTQVVSPRPANSLKLSPLAHFLNCVSIMAQINFHFLKEAFLGYSSLHGSLPSLKFLEKKLIVLQYLIMYCPVFFFFFFFHLGHLQKKKLKISLPNGFWKKRLGSRFFVIIQIGDGLHQESFCFLILSRQWLLKCWESGQLPQENLGFPDHSTVTHPPLTPLLIACFSHLIFFPPCTSLAFASFHEK